MLDLYSKIVLPKVELTVRFLYRTVFILPILERGRIAEMLDFFVRTL